MKNELFPIKSETTFQVHPSFSRAFGLFVPLLWSLIITLFFAQTSTTKLYCLIPLVIVALYGVKDFDLIKSYPEQVETPLNLLFTLFIICYLTLLLFLTTWTRQLTFPTFILTLLLTVVTDTAFLHGYFVTSLEASYSYFKEVCLYHLNYV